MRNEILAVNIGSSSVKLALFRREQGLTLLREQHDSLPVPKALRSFLTGEESICGVVHRFVHGGSSFLKTTRLTPSVLRALKKLTPLAPLHLPLELQGVDVVRALLGSVPQFATFDTAFHRTMRPEAKQYALPFRLTEKYGIERFGFHGLSHHYLAQVYTEEKGKRHKIITLHMGAGVSLTAIQDGCSVDTSMGFTPTEGVMMATRSGDVDPGVIAFLSKKRKMDAIYTLLNEASGLKGVSGLSGDMRTLLRSTTKRAQYALDLYCYRIAKMVGALMVTLGGVDALLFTGGVGENAAPIREKILKELQFLDFHVDPEKNARQEARVVGVLYPITERNASRTAFVVATHENFLLARELSKVL